MQSLSYRPLLQLKIEHISNSLKHFLSEFLFCVRPRCAALLGRWEDLRKIESFAEVSKFFIVWALAICWLMCRRAQGGGGGGGAALCACVCVVVAKADRNSKIRPGPF